MSRASLLKTLILAGTGLIGSLAFASVRRSSILIAVLTLATAGSPLPHALFSFYGPPDQG